MPWVDQIREDIFVSEVYLDSSDSLITTKEVHTTLNVLWRRIMYKPEHVENKHDDDYYPDPTTVWQIACDIIFKPCD